MSYASQVLADGAVGFWKLAETNPTTSTVATDQAGNQNGVYSNGNFSNVTGIAGGAGVTAVALSTSSNLNKVTIADVAAQRLTDAAATLEFWVKRSATQGATQRIMGTASANGWEFQWNASNQVQAVKLGVSSIANSTNAITDTTTWHHCVWTKAGATNKIYVDGIDVTSAVVNATLTTAAGWVIYEDASNNNAPPSGMALAMVAIYPTALSAATVLTHYNIGAAVNPSNSVAPAVTGTTTVGQVLSTTDGTWTSTGTPAYTYAWQDSADGSTGWANIASATSSTYTIGAGEATKFIRCNVTDTDSAGAATTPSNVVGPIAAAAGGSSGVIRTSAESFLIIINSNY